jgi:hypothetical protein
MDRIQSSFYAWLLLVKHFQFISAINQFRDKQAFTSAIEYLDQFLAQSIFPSQLTAFLASGLNAQPL